MSRANKKVAFGVTNETTGALLSGASVELRRGATTIAMSEMGTSGRYKNDSVPVGEWQVWVDSVDKNQTIAVGAGEPSQPDFATDTNKYLKSKPDSTGYELVDLEVSEAPQDGNPYGRKDGAWVDLYTLLAKKNGDLAEAFSALSLTVSNAVTANSILSAILDSNGATDLLLRRNGVLKVTVGDTNTTFATDVTTTGDFIATADSRARAVRVTGSLNDSESTGAGFEIEYMDLGSGRGFGGALLPYDRDASTFKPLWLRASTIYVDDPIVSTDDITTTGDISAVDISASGVMTLSTAQASSGVPNNSFFRDSGRSNKLSYKGVSGGITTIEP